MSAKSVGTIVLLAFVAVSIGYLIMSEAKAPADGAGAIATPPAQVAVPTTPGEQEPGEQEANEQSPVANAEPEATGAEAAPTATTAAAAAVPAHKVIAYYFHNTARCMTCRKIERLAHEALREEFAAEFEDGDLEWRLVNMEEPANEHFVQDYQLVASSLVIVDLYEGEQRDRTLMEKVWQYVHDDEAAFKQYVVDQARAYLGSSL
jgi:hypothetical protein